MPTSPAADGGCVADPETAEDADDAEGAGCATLLPVSSAPPAPLPAPDPPGVAPGPSVGGPSSPPSSLTTGGVPAVGARLAGYAIERAIARGGMGQVFLAVDERLQRKVALKVLARADADDEARARFLREARALARVEHPGVVRVLASGDDDGVAWMALDYIEGDSLTELCNGGPIDEETAVALLAQVARGLAAVHAVGVVHRDVKPDNLLVDAEANVKIVDFGVAWFVDGGGGFTTRAGVVVGTPHFMSPEQARGGAVDARSDAWSLGATLWLLLVGRPPFWGSDDEADLDILARVVRDPVPDLAAAAPATSPATCALIAALLNKDPAERPADLAAVAVVLDDIAGALARGEVPGASSTPPIPTPANLSSGAPSSGEATLFEATGPQAAPGSAAPVEAVPTRAGLSPAAMLGALGVVVLIGTGVAGGVFFGRRSVEPRVQERVVERVVTVEVPVEIPGKAPVEVPVDVPASSLPSRPAAPSSSPPPPPPPTVEELAHALAATSTDDLSRAVDRLVAQNDPASRAALALVARTAGPAGDVVVERALFDARVDKAALLDAALRSPTRTRALLVVEQLQRRRDDGAYARLQEIARDHADPRVRAAAARARDSIFSASDDTP
jgi:serine/threonine protein kinase